MNAMQLKMARVALSLSVREAATLTGVSHDTISRIEAGEALKVATITRVRAALEAAGVIFVEENGEGPGVRLRKQEEKPMEPLVFESASQLSVRLRTMDSDGPIVVAIERAAIDDRFRLSSSTEKLRIEIVMSNLKTLSEVVRERIRRREWTQGVAGKPRQVVLRLKDLDNVQLQEPV